MDADLVNRAAEEREKIFERYDLGRQGPVDPWEEPDYSIYEMVDRWVHKFLYFIACTAKTRATRRLRLVVSFPLLAMWWKNETGENSEMFMLPPTNGHRE